MCVILCEKGVEFGVIISEWFIFIGISDMSWFGIVDFVDIVVVNVNMFVFVVYIYVLFVGLFCINFGFWGCDYY